MEFKLPSCILINKTLSSKTLTKVVGKLPFTEVETSSIYQCKLYKRDNSKRIIEEDFETESKLNIVPFYNYILINGIMFPIYNQISYTSQIAVHNFYDFKEIYDNFQKTTNKVSFDRFSTRNFIISKNIESMPLEKITDDFTDKEQTKTMETELKKFSANVDEVDYIKFHIINPIGGELPTYKIGVLHLLNNKGFLPWTKTTTEIKFFGMEMRVFPN